MTWFQSFDLADSSIDVFLPQPYEIFWSAIVLVLLGVAFYKFLLPMANDVLTKRSEAIEGGIAKASELKTEAEELHAKYTAEIKNARLEAARIQDDARISAQQIIADAHTKARKEAELISKNAIRAIESERKAAETALKKQIGSLAMAMTQKMLNNGLDNSVRQSKMIDNSIARYVATANADSKDVDDSTARKNSTARSTNRRRRVKRSSKVSV